MAELQSDNLQFFDLDLALTSFESRQHKQRVAKVSHLSELFLHLTGLGLGRVRSMIWG